MTGSRPGRLLTGEDPLLADIVEELVLHLSVGDTRAVAAAIDANPEYADRMRAILPTLEILADMKARGGSAPSSPNPEGSAFKELGVLGDYRLLREIGRGGMGVVYEAEQVSLRRRVALKVLPLAGLLDARALARFRNEAQVAAGLHHSHIVPIYSVGCERGVHYYAMQFIDGLSLDRLIEPASATFTDTHPLAVLSTSRANNESFCSRVAELGAQAAEALQYAHHRNIVHRDIKPGNLLVDVHGHIWIADFGVARVAGASELTVTGDVLGTLRYMSPEQASGQMNQLDHRTDIYSLGATLYELLTRHPVFAEERREDILRQLVNEDPIPPRRHAPDIPADLETIILKSLAKAPADRYASAADLAADLRRFCDGRSILARRPTWVQRGRRWVRRNRALVRTMSISAVVILFIAAGAGWRISHERLSRRFQEELARTRQGLVDQHAYVTGIDQAAHALDRNRIDELQQHLLPLQRGPGELDLRGFECGYLWNLSQRIEPPFGRHEGEAYCARFSPDGRWLATAGADGVRIWEWPSRSEVRHLRQAQADVNGVAWSPDGTLLASFSDDKHIRIYRTDTWSLGQDFVLAGKLVAGQFTPDGQRLVVGERNGMPMALDPDGNRVYLIDTRTWETLKIFGEPGLTLQGVAVSHDGRLAVAASYDGVHVFDLVNLQSRRRLDLPMNGRKMSTCTAVAFEKNGSLLAVGVGPGILILTVDDGHIVAELDGHGGVEGLVFTHDGRSLVSAHRHNEVCLWEKASSARWNLAGRYPFSEPLWCVDVHDDGSMVSTGRAGGVGLRSRFRIPDRRRLSMASEVIDDWLKDPDGRKEPYEEFWQREPLDPDSGYRGSVFAWSAAGELLTATDLAHVTTWDLHSLSPIEQNDVTRNWLISCLARSADGRVDAVGSREGTICFLHRQRAELRKISIVPLVTVEMSFSGDNETLFVLAYNPHPQKTADNCQVLAIDIETLQQVPNRAIAQWTGSIHSRLASGADFEFFLTNRDVLARKHISELMHHWGVFTVSRDARVLAKYYLNGDTVQFWEAPDWRRQNAFVGVRKEFSNLALSPDGVTLAAAASDGKVYLWHTSTGRQLLSLDPYLLHAQRVTFAPDGSALICFGANHRGREEMVVWEAPLPGARSVP